MLREFLDKKGVDTCDVEEVLFQLYSNGLISTNFYYYKEVYLFINELMALGHNKTEAVSETMQHFKISRQTCFNIYRKMRDVEKGE